MQELGAARSRANTHCSSSLYDELETAELTGYESSEEDLEVDDRADVMMSKFLGSRASSLTREMSLAEELAQSLGALESSGRGHSPGNQEMSLAEEMNATDVDQTPRDEKTLQDFVERLDRDSLTEGFVKQSGRCQDDGSEHQSKSLADELAETVFDGRRHPGGFSGPGTPQQEGANTLANVVAQSGNTLSLADELSQVSSSMPNVKLESSSTLVGLGGGVYLGGDERMQSGIIVGEDDEDEEEGMMIGVPMATQCLNQGLSLADELAGMGYQQSYEEDGAEGEEEDRIIGGGDGGCDKFGRSERGAEMVASRVREGGGKGFITAESGGGGGGGGVAVDDDDDDDAEIISLETPKASPSRSPRPGDVHIKYRQVCLSSLNKIYLFTC